MQATQRKTAYRPTPAPAKKRVVKMEGNVAYINSGFSERIPGKPRKVKQGQTAGHLKTAKRPQTARRIAEIKKEARKKRAGLASTLFVLIIAFGAMALLISRYAAVCAIGAQNSEIEDKIEAVETEIDKLQIDLQLQDDLEYVLETAQDELGMVYPSQDQRVYMNTGG